MSQPDGKAGVGVAHSNEENGEPTRRDPWEGRGGQSLESPEGHMADAQESVPMFTKQWRIAERFPQRAFTSLAHHIDAQWLMSAYLMTRRDGAIRIDGQTADDFASDFEANIQRLLEEAKSGRYRAPPVRRVHIPKGDGRTTRPIGIPTFEDKVLQRAVVSLLEPLYEHDFLPCSFGFRPGRSPH